MQAEIVLTPLLFSKQQSEKLRGTHTDSITGLGTPAVPALISFGGKRFYFKAHERDGGAISGDGII